MCGVGGCVKEVLQRLILVLYSAIMLVHTQPHTHTHTQLVELRERATRYKKRAEGVNIRHLLPLTRADLNYRSDSPSTTLTPSQTTPSSPTPSDSVSCTYSNCHHHIKGDPKQFSMHPFASPALNKPVGDPTSGSMEVQDIEEEKSEELLQASPPPPKTKPHPPVVTQPAPLEADDQSGRVQTPIIQKSFSDYRRHHLDRTTPVAGGLFISPQKKQPAEVILPYPPHSPKYRRDMRSSAPISPAPKNTKDESVHVQVSFSQSSGSSSSSIEADPTTKQPLSVPTSSSPYHTRCVPRNRPKSDSVRKLDFKQSQISSKTVPKSYSYRVQGLTADKTNCDICGAHLRPPPVSNIGSTTAHSTTSHPLTTQTSNVRSSFIQSTASKPYTTQSSNLRPSFVQSTSSKHQTTKSGVTSGLVNGGISSLKKPPVSVSSTQAHTSHRPHSSTNYMTRLPPQIGSQSRDYDETSLASLSLSSCSVASDLLRKAQDRRDHFWSQPPHVTAT